MIDFNSSFAHIMSKRKITSNHLKKVGIFVLSICYHAKINSGNTGFILAAIMVTL